MTPRYRTAFFAPSGFATATPTVSRQAVGAASETKRQAETGAASRTRTETRRSLPSNHEAA